MQKKSKIGFNNGFTLTVQGCSPKIPKDADFWRVYLDCCQHGEVKMIHV